MSRESLGATGFEATNLEENKNDLLKEISTADSGTLKGTLLGEETSLEKKLSEEQQAEQDQADVKTKSQKDAKRSDSAINLEENEFNNMFKGVKNYKEGDIVTGVVSKIVNGAVFVDIAYKAEGIIEPDEVSNKPFVKAIDVCKPGERISVKILRLENKAGNPVLSKKRADYDLAWETLNRALKHNDDISVNVTNVKDGGISVDFEGIMGFIPNNQLSKEDLNDLDSFVGKNIYVKVLKVQRGRRKVILSHKSSREKSQKQLHEAMQKIKPGDVLKGKVSSIKSFGAFVNLGEFDGLVHISEISWSHVEKVEDVLAVGQEVEVYVLGIDESNNRISLSMKKLTTDPWQEVANKLTVGEKIKCKITRLVPFGAFAYIQDGVEGLIHLTELSDSKQVKYPEEVVKVGDEYEATILRLDTKNRKIALTLRADRIVKEDPAAQPAEHE